MLVHYNKFDAVVNDNYERRLFLKSIEETIDLIKKQEEVNAKVLFGKNPKQKLLELIKEKRQLRDALYEI